MTSAKIQPFCKKHSFNIGLSDGSKTKTLELLQKKKLALHMYNTHFCPISKIKGISFDKTIEELKLNLEVVENVTSDKHVKSFVKYEYKPRKIQLQLTNMVAFTQKLNTDKAVLYSICIYKLSKLSGK